MIRLLLAAGLLWAASPAWEDERRRMVETVADYSAEHRVRDPRVLAALREVPRHEFVPPELRAHAYADRPLPIGEGQTISQPFIVGYMTELLQLEPGDRVLEVGTGSGYQAAVLAELVSEVYTVEILPGLARRAEATLKRLGYGNVRVRAGDGYKGWREAAPFDAVIVTCAPDRIPPALVRQLKTGGRMAIPVGDKDGVQELVLARKTAGGLERQKKLDVRFVPMTGREVPEP